MKNRIIKFRIWCNNKMHEPFILDNNFDCIVGWLETGILMQSTGFVDMAGKEIFESDFFVIDEVKYLVVWNEFTASFDADNLEAKEVEPLSGWITDNSKILRVVIRGNDYEHLSQK